MPLHRLRRLFVRAVDETVSPEPKPPPPPTIVEWTARALSLLFLVGLLGLIVYQGMQPPVLPRLVMEARLEEAELRGEEWALPITILNEATVPLEAVELVVALRAGERVVEEAPISFMLLGPGERINAEVWFAENPNDYEVTLDVQSLQHP